MWSSTEANSLTQRIKPEIRHLLANRSVSKLKIGPGSESLTNVNEVFHPSWELITRRVNTLAQERLPVDTPYPPYLHLTD